MRNVLTVLALAYAAAYVIGGVGGVLLLAGLGLVGLGFILVIDAVTQLRAERWSHRRIHNRLYAHTCPDCGLLHGGFDH